MRGWITCNLQLKLGRTAVRKWARPQHHRHGAAAAWTGTGLAWSKNAHAWLGGPAFLQEVVEATAGEASKKLNLNLHDTVGTGDGKAQPPSEAELAAYGVTPDFAEFVRTLNYRRVGEGERRSTRGGREEGRGWEAGRGPQCWQRRQEGVAPPLACEHCAALAPRLVRCWLAERVVQGSNKLTIGLWCAVKASRWMRQQLQRHHSAACALHADSGAGGGQNSSLGGICIHPQLYLPHRLSFVHVPIAACHRLRGSCSAPRPAHLTSPRRLR